jgi:hypothetical protein
VGVVQLDLPTPQVYFSKVRTHAENGAKIAAGASRRASSSGYSGKTLGLIGAKRLAGPASNRHSFGAFLTVRREARSGTQPNLPRFASDQR